MDAQTFGKYQLTGRLGEGGMAVVFRAKLFGPGGFEKILCVKQIRAELAARPEFVDLFVAEAKLTVQLTHANIVPVYELGMVDGTYFLALELVDGPQLAELMEKGPVQPPLAAYVVEQVLRGLDYAHRRGVVHRDLSPANVLVSRDGEVKIVDFGIAQAAGAAATAGGSRGYMAPEQERPDAHSRADARSDLYSVGVLLWELVRGGRFDHSWLGAPQALAEIVARATASTPEQRFADAAAMLQAVSRFLRSATAATTQAELGALVRRSCPDVPVRTLDGQESVAHSTPAGPRTLPSGSREVTFATRIPPVEPTGGSGRSSAIVAALSLVCGLAGLGMLAAFKARPQAPPQASIAVAPARTAPAPLAAHPGKALAHLVVRSVPGGAEVRLAERLLGQTPLEVELPLDTSGPLQLRKVGFQPVDRALSPSMFSGSPPRGLVTARLDPIGKGTLTLGALPWAHVTIDGRKQKDAPFESLELAAGPHLLLLDCPATRRSFKLAIEVEAGSALRRVVDLRGEPKLIE